jgi:DNA-binding NarL/FixJ family response regulator
VNAFEHIWKDLKSWLHHKRIFAVDADAYENLRLVAEREQRSPQEVAAQLFEQASQDQTVLAFVSDHWAQLSPRQKQIVAYVCRGDTTPQIASQLHIAQTTVKSHVEIAMRKFGVKSRVELRNLLQSFDLSPFL